MSHSHHHHDHMHSHVTTNNKKVLFISFLIIGLYMFIEIIGGLLANSLALLSDGIHMFSDTFSLGVALVAFIYAEKNATTTKTFGYKRFFVPSEVQSKEMLIISIIGLIVNIVVAFFMFKGGDTSHNLNMRGAFLHVIGDLLGSVGAITAAILIWAFGWTIADPIASILVSVIILKSAWGITKSSINILMEGTPSDVDIDEVITTIKKDSRIQSVHDCHVWTISNDMNALSCHVVVDHTLTMKECELLLENIEHDLLHLNIHHMTIQLETPNHKHDESIICSGTHSHSHNHHAHHHAHVH
ncbi:MAG: CDF family zinc efflux transporter CzrB [Staphylococcus aureus]|nr:CDF family zinc efflux transporter CzrB [Staphylococcus aureus]